MITNDRPERRTFQPPPSSPGDPHHVNVFPSNIIETLHSQVSVSRRREQSLAQLPFELAVLEEGVLSARQRIDAEHSGRAHGDGHDHYIEHGHVDSGCTFAVNPMPSTVSVDNQLRAHINFMAELHAAQHRELIVYAAPGGATRNCPLCTKRTSEFSSSTQVDCNKHDGARDGLRHCVICIQLRPVSTFHGRKSACRLHGGLNRGRTTKLCNLCGDYQLKTDFRDPKDKFCNRHIVPVSVGTSDDPNLRLHAYERELYRLRYEVYHDADVRHRDDLIFSHIRDNTPVLYANWQARSRQKTNRGTAASVPNAITVIQDKISRSLQTNKPSKSNQQGDKRPSSDEPEAEFLVSKKPKTNHFNRLEDTPTCPCCQEQRQIDDFNHNGSSEPTCRVCRTCLGVDGSGVCAIGEVQSASQFETWERLICRTCCSSRICPGREGVHTKKAMPLTEFDLTYHSANNAQTCYVRCNACRAHRQAETQPEVEVFANSQVKDGEMQWCSSCKRSKSVEQFDEGRKTCKTCLPLYNSREKARKRKKRVDEGMELVYTSTGPVKPWSDPTFDGSERRAVDELFEDTETEFGPRCPNPLPYVGTIELNLPVDLLNSLAVLLGIDDTVDFEDYDPELVLNSSIDEILSAVIESDENSLSLPDEMWDHLLALNGDAKAAGFSALEHVDTEEPDFLLAVRDHIRETNKQSRKQARDTKTKRLREALTPLVNTALQDNDPGSLHLAPDSSDWNTILAGYKRGSEERAKRADQRVAAEALARPFVEGLELHTTEVMTQVQIEGDGNCLFRAAAHTLFGSEHHYKLVRSLVQRWHRLATGRDGEADINPDLNILRGGVYEQLNQQTGAPTAGFRDATLLGQLYTGDGYWASTEMVQLLADTFGAVFFVHVAWVRDGNLVWESGHVYGDVTDDTLPQHHLYNYMGLDHWQTGRPINPGFRFTDHLTRPELNDPLWNGTGTSTVLDVIPSPLRRAINQVPLSRTAITLPVEFDTSEERTFDSKNDIPTGAYKRALIIPRVVPKSAMIKTPPLARLKLITMEFTGPESVSTILASRRESKRPPFIQFGRQHIIDLNDSGLFETESERLTRHGINSQLRALDPKTGAPPTNHPMMPVYPHDSDVGKVGTLRRVGDGTQLSDNDIRSCYYPNAQKLEMMLAVWRQTNDLDVDSLLDLKDEPRGAQPYNFEGVRPEPALERPPPVTIIIGRFSDVETAAMVQAQLVAHNLVLHDYHASLNLHRIVFGLGAAIPIPPPAQVHRIWINGRSANEKVPLYDSPHVPPELLQFINIMDQLSAMQPLQPNVTFLIRALSGFSVGRTWAALHRHWPDLDVSVVFALRVPFVAGKIQFDGHGQPGVIGNVGFLNHANPSQRNLFYTEAIPLQDIANAEEGDVANASPAAIAIVAWMRLEEDARTAWMTWQDAIDQVWILGNDRNGFI